MLKLDAKSNAEKSLMNGKNESSTKEDQGK